MKADPDAVTGGDYLILNPAGVGDLDSDPQVYVGPDLLRRLNPCACGGVNGFHQPDCDHAEDHARSS